MVAEAPVAVSSRKIRESKRPGSGKSFIASMMAAQVAATATSLCFRLKAAPKDLAVSFLKPRTAAKSVQAWGTVLWINYSWGGGHYRQAGPGLTSRALKFSLLQPRVCLVGLNNGSRVSLWDS